MKVTIICITSPDSMKVFFRLVNKKKKKMLTSFQFFFAFLLLVSLSDCEL